MGKTAVAPEPVSPLALASSSRLPYQVQIGAFLDLATAQTLRDSLRGRGFDVGITDFQAGNGESWHLAQAGDFADRAEASRVVAQLHRDIGIDALIVRAPPPMNEPQ
ncbi:MAG: SPOR domain-containing protein [Rhodospirillales bacterium]|nr:SPOR domain-containing protein [Rhodospirillales bacterium]